MTLSEFLLARIAEDEAAARFGLSESAYGHYADTAAGEVIAMGWHEGVADEGMEHFARWMPARVLAECEAKRRIVVAFAQTSRNNLEDPFAAGQWSALESTLCLLALPYASLPDFNPAWRL